MSTKLKCAFKKNIYLKSLDIQGKKREAAINHDKVGQFSTDSFPTEHSYIFI